LRGYLRDLVVALVHGVVQRGVAKLVKMVNGQNGQRSKWSPTSWSTTRADEASSSCLLLSSLELSHAKVYGYKVNEASVNAQSGQRQSRA
jgi:hypothetical protein